MIDHNKKNLETVIKVNKQVIEAKKKRYARLIKDMVKTESEIISAHRDLQTAESELRKRPWMRRL